MIQSVSHAHRRTSSQVLWIEDDLERLLCVIDVAQSCLDIFVQDVHWVSIHNRLLVFGDTFVVIEVFLWLQNPVPLVAVLLLSHLDGVHVINDLLLSSKVWHEVISWGWLWLGQVRNPSVLECFLRICSVLKSGGDILVNSEVGNNHLGINFVLVLVVVSVATLG